MFYKDMQKKLLITLGIVLWTLYGLGNIFAITLHFENLNLSAFEDKFSMVHFMTPGNNFWWSIFRLPTKSVSPTIISIGSEGDVKTCTKQVRGIYFNSQRGKRLRPLDVDTLQLLKDQNSSYDYLILSWWLYTTCDSGHNYGIFGKIDYNRWGITTHIVAGTKLKYNQNKIIVDMANSLQYFDNKVPIWYIYDSYGGIGYVGWLLSGHENLITYLNNGWSIQSWFIYSWDLIVSNTTGRETEVTTWTAAMETMRNLIIQGSVGLSKIMEQSERISFLGNTTKKTIIYNGTDINSSTIINFAKQKAQELCQGKQFNQPLSSPGPILCYDTETTIDLSTNDYQNKTIIVENANVILQNSMWETSAPLDIFIDKGNLYLDNTATTISFNEQGYPGTPTIYNGMYLKGIFIVNGLLLAWSPWSEVQFQHKLHLQGKITMLNTPTLPTQARKDQVEELLWTNIYEPWINLQNVFKRTCGLDGTGSDLSQCTSNNIISWIPLVILNGNYPSNLLQ